MNENQKKALELLNAALPYLQAASKLAEAVDFDDPPAVSPTGAHTQNVLWYAERAIGAIRGEKDEPDGYQQTTDESGPPHVSLTSSSQAPDGRVHLTAWLHGRDPGDPVTLSLTPRQALAIIQQLATTLYGMTR